MGRSYVRELATLAETYASAQVLDISSLTEVVQTVRTRPLVVVGSGGSLTAANFVARLHETGTHLSARVLTPLEFLQNPVLHDSGVLLLSASGSNPDILAAAHHAVRSEAVTLAAVSTRVGTPLSAQLGQYPYATAFEFAGPASRDGFLATNSLVLTCAAMARAYDRKMPVDLPALAEPLKSDLLVQSLLLPRTVVLASGWALAAAVDLESKWSEMGFGCVTVTDARNFAHGRHYGLSRVIDETLVLGLTTPAEATVLENTLAKLPRTATAATLDSPLLGPAGSLDLIVRVLSLAGAVGAHSGVDPGRPRVPAFGRALYRAKLPSQRARVRGGAPPEDVWIQRKVSTAVWANVGEDTRRSWRVRCRDWVDAVESERVGGVVLDYDGTLCEASERFTAPASPVGAALTSLLDQGMRVGIATGRGKSISEALRTVLPPRLWRQIRVGMYNGGVLFRLDERPPDEVPREPEMEHAYAILAASPVLQRLADLRLRPTQVTAMARMPLPDGMLRSFVVEALAMGQDLSAVDVFASGHSVDVIVRTVSKRRVVETLRQEIPESDGLNVMTIGDQGQAGGNDAPFLAHTLGLSVERVSSSFESCWNIAPLGSRRTSAMLQYLAALRPARDRGFRFSIRNAAGLGRQRALSGSGAGARSEAHPPRQD